MASVTFDTVVGGDGSTVTDDDDPSTGLGNGGSILRLVPMMEQVVNVANHVVSVAGGTGQDAIDAAASAAAALVSENNAAASESNAAISESNAAQSALDAASYVGGANSLETTSSPVIVNLASPPTTGQVLTATSPTNATWQSVTIQNPAGSVYLSQNFGGF